MAQGPCLNPNCGSHGAAHPNCRCYGGMADGGEVIHFCDTDQPHEKTCHYYAEGGGISPDDVEVAAPAQSAIDPEDVAVKGSISPDDVETKSEKYGSLGQQALTAVEGAAQGIAGPIATGVELGLSKLGVPGISADDIAARREENPWTHGIAETAGLLSPVGEGAAIAKAVEHIPAALSVGGKAGAAALKGMIASGLFQTSDEMSKAMIGQGDPNTPVSSAIAHVGAAGLFGLGTGALFSASSSGLQKLADEKVGEKASQFIKDFGERWHQKTSFDPVAEAEATKGLSKGAKFADTVFKQGPEKIASTISKTAGTAVGTAIGGPTGTFGGYYVADKLAPYLENIVGKPVSKTAIPAVIKALSTENAQSVMKAIDYSNQANKGFQKINNTIKNVVTGTGQQAYEGYASERDRQKLKDYIDKGGVGQELQPTPQYAEGGDVKQAPGTPDEGLASIFPEQHVLVNAAKGRISQYLSSVKPNNPKGLMFDAEMKHPAKEQSYDNAIDLALHPLSIMNHVKQGTLLHEHVQHLSSMYPELKQHLDQTLTNALVAKKDDEEKPSYKSRVSMGLFLGTPLDSTMTPQSIIAAQPIPKPPPQQAQAQGKAKRGTSTLGKGNKSYQTQSQSAESDRNDRD